MRRIILLGIFVGLFFPVICWGEESALEIAFKKEYAFLDQQRKSLEKQSREFIEKNNKEELSIQNKIDVLKDSLINLDIELENKQAILDESALSLESKQEDQNRLQQLFDQASATLNLTHEKDPSVASLYLSALSMINKENRVTSKPGHYFLADGEKVVGTIINIGRVASFAVGEAGSGMLVPAGEGKLKLWKSEKINTALALNAGESIDTINLFLYEDKNQAIDEEIDKTLYDIVNSGGIIAWLIVATGGIAILMVLLRVFFLKRASKGTNKLIVKISEFIRNGKIKDAISVCEKQRGAAARVVTSTLRNLDRERDHLEDVVAESILHENNYLNRYGAAILVIAAVAPLMGLLGTVTGMIETFDIITQFGTGDPKLLSVGISTALVTTQLGLIVAIPALVSGNLLSGWSNKIKDNMEQAALSVINLHALHKDSLRKVESL